MRRLSLTNLTALGLGLAFLYAPIAILVVYSFNASRLVTVWGGWSTRWYAALLEDRAMTDAALAADPAERLALLLERRSEANHRYFEDQAERLASLERQRVSLNPEGPLERGYTLIPLDLHFAKGRIKLQIALAKGKLKHDKRASEREKEWQREKTRLLRPR